MPKRRYFWEHLGLYEGSRPLGEPVLWPLAARWTIPSDVAFGLCSGLLTRQFWEVQSFDPLWTGSPGLSGAGASMGSWLIFLFFLLLCLPHSVSLCAESDSDGWMLQFHCLCVRVWR